MKIINKKEGIICIDDSNYQLFTFNESGAYVGNGKGNFIFDITKDDLDLLLKELNNDLLFEDGTNHFVPNRISKDINYCDIVFDTILDGFSIKKIGSSDKLGMYITGKLIDYLFKKEGYEEVAKWLAKTFLNAKEIFEEISDENKLLTIL